MTKVLYIKLLEEHVNDLTTAAKLMQCCHYGK